MNNEVENDHPNTSH